MALRRRAHDSNSDAPPLGEPSQTARERRDESLRATALDAEAPAPNGAPVATSEGDADSAMPPNATLISETLASARRAAEQIRARADADAERIRARADAERIRARADAERIRAQADAEAPEPPAEPVSEPVAKPDVIAGTATHDVAPPAELAEAIEEAQHAAALLQRALSRLADRLTVTPPK